MLSSKNFIFLLYIFIISSQKPARQNALPKTIWTYHDEEQQNYVQNICIERMRKTLQSSRWVLEIITPNSLFNYLQNRDEYLSILQERPDILDFSQKMQLAKLFLLKQYGGIWVDPSIFLMRDFDWIKQIDNMTAVNKHGKNVYEMIIFKPQHQTDQPQLSSSIEWNNHQISAEVILALKQSEILKDWIASMIILLKQNTLTEISQENYNQANSIQLLTKTALRNALANDKISEQDTYISAYTYYRVWQYHYYDLYEALSEKTKNQDPYIIIDYLLKYPFDQTMQNLQIPRHFIDLSQIEEKLNLIISPNISMLQYLSDSPYLTYLCFNNINCIHYIEEGSIMSKILLNQTVYFDDLQYLINSDESFSSVCASLYFQTEWNKVGIIIGFTLYLLAFIFIMKIQSIFVVMIYQLSIKKIKPLTFKIKSKWTSYKKSLNKQIMPV